MEPASLLEQLAVAVANPTRGVVSLVDDLLEIGSRQDITLEWVSGQCVVGLLGAVPADRIEVPFPKAVVRAILARLATLCNEPSPGEVSPYGGRGEIAIGEDPSRVVLAEFVNTSSQQSVTLVAKRPHLVAALDRSAAPRIQAGDWASR